VKPGAGVVLDLRYLSFIDSSGLMVLVEAHRALNDKNGRLTVIDAPPTAMSVFDRTGLSDTLDIRPDDPMRPAHRGHSLLAWRTMRHDQGGGV
jgi:anti-anti-sigma factor